MRHASPRPWWRFRCRFGLPREVVGLDGRARCAACGVPVVEHA